MWLPAALKRWLHGDKPSLQAGGYADVYNAHMPHYAYDHDRPDCLTSTSNGL